MNKLEKAKKLISDVNNKISQMEYNAVTFAGVKNVSRSDLDSVEMYAVEYINSGGCSFGNFMEPRDSVEKILTKYGITVESKSWSW